MKKLLLSIGILLPFALLITYQVHRDKQQEHSWQTFEKKDSEINRYPSLPKELQQIKANKLPPPTAAPRKPASVAPSSNKRRIINPKQEDLSALPFRNQKNSKWQDHLAKELLHFQPNDTKVMIKKLEGIVRVKKSQKEYLEHVLITFLTPGGGHSNSFEALVDSQSGRVVKTWGFTKQERLRQKTGFQLQ